MLDENDMLRENLEAQLERLVQQLSDLEECRYDLRVFFCSLTKYIFIRVRRRHRSDMTDDEYNESKEDTVEQLKEFNERLSKIAAGDMTLHDKLSIVRLVSTPFTNFRCR